MLLGLTIDRNDCTCCVTIWHEDLDHLEDAISERFVDVDYENPDNNVYHDVMFAARKAIVTAAVEIGKLK